MLFSWCTFIDSIFRTHCILRSSILPGEEMLLPPSVRAEQYLQTIPRAANSESANLVRSTVGRARAVKQWIQGTSGRRRVFLCCFATFSAGTATLARTARSVSRGSKSRLGSYSLPLPFESPEAKRKTPHLLLCSSFWCTNMSVS